MFGLPGGAILPLYDAMARGTTVRHVLARHEQGAGHMAEGYARASGRSVSRSRHPARARRTSSPDCRRLDGLDAARLHHRPGRARTSSAPTPSRSATSPASRSRSSSTRGSCRTSSEMPHVMNAAFHVASTGRCGPVLVDIPRDVQEAALEFAYPDKVISRGGSRPVAGTPGRSSRPPQAIAEAERPDPLRGRRRAERARADELNELAEAARPPRRHDADGEERLSRVARAARRLARNARAELVELGLTRPTSSSPSARASTIA